MTDDTLYKCPECGWIGTERQMGSDYIAGEDGYDETWSHWICPSCDRWLELDDYEVVMSEPVRTC